MDFAIQLGKTKSTLPESVLKTETSQLTAPKAQENCKRKPGEMCQFLPTMLKDGFAWYYTIT